MLKPFNSFLDGNIEYLRESRAVSNTTRETGFDLLNFFAKLQHSWNFIICFTYLLTTELYHYTS